MVICLERGADLYLAQLMPLPLTVSCFSERVVNRAALTGKHDTLVRRAPGWPSGALEWGVTLTQRTVAVKSTF